MATIAKVAVLGAGVMGAGIAAQVANSGTPVVLLDIVPKEGENRNAIAEGAVARMLKTDPAPFMHPKNARLITTGNLEDHLHLLAECDWIVEAVVENLDVKRDLYRKVDAVRKAGSIVSSNTSTIPLSMLIEGMPDSFAADFIITHFFNPPRYMRLLEVVASPKTRPEAQEAMRRFGDVKLGKTVVDAKDTPGFIGNRIGIYWMQCAVTEAMEGGLTVEEADAVLGRPMGIPKTGVFGLLDLVGIDLMPHVMKSMVATLSGDDPLHTLIRDDSLVRKMIAEGYTGRKGKGGFYRVNRAAGKVKEAIDFKSGEYRRQEKASLESLDAAKSGGLRALVSHPDRGGQYAWKVLAGTLGYAAALVPEIADTVVGVDEAMRLGYNWKFGPFELIDKLGPAWLAEKLAADGRPVPELLKKVGDGTFYRIESGQLQFFGTDGRYHDVTRPAGVVLLSDIKRRSNPVARNGSASLWDIGDGVACLEFHTKMNALDNDVMAMIRKAIGIVERDFKALVIHNEGSHFSAGANLGLALFAANIGLWPEIESLVQEGQETYKALKYAPFPVVGAPSGLALGGGCEVLLHCDVVQAHAETYVGLVEVGVGLIPAWGGCKEMLA
ncbi:MAG TPA: 3-hydroxyacyl-CoA dehydrogenase/enoyl-CoA hydratase family protein, partial [Azospirillaceae bacterium]|nr:3-hydroxyacyl-CoA dehydrogenase/enoyl-CoA hydratase family protein [Azospirillaceae bacterium]